jgi:hypothetical protein
VCGAHGQAGAASGRSVVARAHGLARVSPHRVEHRCACDCGAHPSLAYHVLCPYPCTCTGSCLCPRHYRVVQSSLPLLLVGG